MILVISSTRMLFNGNLPIWSNTVVSFREHCELVVPPCHHALSGRQHRLNIHTRPAEMAWSPASTRPPVGSQSRPAAVHRAMDAHLLQATSTWQLTAAGTRLAPSSAPALRMAATHAATRILAAAADGAGFTSSSVSSQSDGRPTSNGRMEQSMLDWGSATVIENRCDILHWCARRLCYRQCLSPLDCTPTASFQSQLRLFAFLPCHNSASRLHGLTGHRSAYAATAQGGLTRW